MIEFFADWSDCKLAVASLGFAEMTNKAPAAVAVAVNKVAGPWTAVGAAVATYVVTASGGVIVSAESARRSNEKDDWFGRIVDGISTVTSPIPHVNTYGSAPSIGYHCVVRRFF
jgi:hypothetical protein